MHEGLGLDAVVGTRLLTLRKGGVQKGRESILEFNLIAEELEDVVINSVLEGSPGLLFAVVGPPRSVRPKSLKAVTQTQYAHLSCF